ncbi:MAG: tryptophan--tRNA ligase, partial [Candidatus Paceibacterota bacterium]
MAKPTLISGIKPSGRLHIGNYLGALKNFVELQNSGKYNCLFFVADYHSITSDFDPKEKNKETKDIVSNYLKAGLDPKKSTIFNQSSIPFNVEFSWILSTITSFGDLSRMTQFKDKSKNQ